MQLILWTSTVAQLLFRSKFKVQNDQNEENKDGQLSPGEQLATDNTTKTDACNVGSQQSAKMASGVETRVEKPGSRKRRRTQETVKLEPRPDEAKVATTSPRQLEEARNQAELTDEVKFEKQLAMGLLTFSAGAMISAKSATLGRQTAASGQVHLQGFFFWASIAMWFTSLLMSMFTILVTTFREKSLGLVMYARIINYLSICITVLGVASWISS